MSFLPLSHSASHDLGSVGNSPSQPDPGPIPCTKKHFDQSEKQKYSAMEARTSGDEILTFRIFVSIISLLSQTDSIQNKNQNIRTVIVRSWKSHTKQNDMDPLCIKFLCKGMTRGFCTIISVIYDYLSSMFKEIPNQPFTTI